MSVFSGTPGQQEAAEHLQNALRTGHISHAYILCGEKGSGRMELARDFAQTLLCENRVERNGVLLPCGKCHSCLQAQTFNHPDLIPVVHQKKNDADRGALSVDEIRALRSDVSILPYSGEYKIYILKDAESMTVQAQNALLKVLEEPPSYAILFLLADGISGFLPTVLSRCITLRLHPADRNVLADYLVRVKGIGERAALQLAGLSHGNPGRAAELCSGEGTGEILRETIAFLKNLSASTSVEISSFAVHVSDKKENHTEDVLDFAGSWYRDILVMKRTQDPERLIFTEELQYISSTAQTQTLQALAAVLDALDTAALRRSAGGNDMQILEMCFLSIRTALTSGYNR